MPEECGRTISRPCARGRDLERRGGDRPVAVALHDRRGAPVLARCDLPEPAACRHPSRTDTGAGTRSLPIGGGSLQAGRPVFLVHGHGMISPPRLCNTAYLCIDAALRSSPAARNPALRLVRRQGKCAAGSHPTDGTGNRGHECVPPRYPGTGTLIRMSARDFI